MSTLPETFVTPEEYLAREREADYKSEHYNGRIFAMSGGSRQHDWIISQLSVLIGQHLRGKGCRWYTANMRVLAQPSGLITSPDLSVVCGPPRFADPHVDTLVNPVLLVEVLSPSTEDSDRGRKAAMYRQIPPLQELLLIEQQSYAVALYRRNPDGTWLFIEVAGLDASIEQTSIGYTLHLRELYERVLQEG